MTKNYITKNYMKNNYLVGNYRLTFCDGTESIILIPSKNIAKFIVENKNSLNIKSISATEELVEIWLLS